MTDHFTLRFPTGTARRLAERSRATGIKQRPLAARYVEEGIRRDEHPLVHFVDGPTGRRAALSGTQLDVWEVIATVRDNDGDAAATADYLAVARGSVEAAMVYYAAFQGEIDDEIALNVAEAERGHDAWRASQQAFSR